MSPKGELPKGEYPNLRQVNIFQLSKELYSKVAYREGTEGIIAEVKARYLALEDLNLKENPLVMVLEGVEKPGNLGAVLRSADAAGADAVLICDPLTDLYNPNLIRASIGAIFTVPTVACSSADAIAFLKERGIRILTAQLQDSSNYYDVDMKLGTAIVMGTEATGLTDAWRKAADAHILIPMLGRLDSLNVSVSAAILLYAAILAITKDYKMLPLQVQVSLKRMKNRKEYVFRLSKAVALAALAPAAGGIIGIWSGTGALIVTVAVLTVVLWIDTKMMKDK